MADRDRDYRLLYKSRDIDRDTERYEDARRRLPTALDPYAYPEDRLELKQAVADTRATNLRLRDDYRKYDSPMRGRAGDDNASISTVRDAGKAGTTRTTYAVTDSGLAKESEVVTHAPTAVSAREPTAPTRAPTYRESDEYDLSRTSTRSSARPYDDRDYVRSERIYDIERPRREAGGYVVEIGDADIVGIRSGPGLVEPDRNVGAYRNDPRSIDPPRDSYPRDAPVRNPGYSRSVYVDRQDARTSATSLDNEQPYMSGARQERAPTMKSARSQGDFRGPPTASTRRDDDWESTTAAPYGPSRQASRQSTRREEDDYTFVEKTTTRPVPTIHETFRDPFHDEPFGKGGGRSRGDTLTQAPSEADYVMVSPPRDGATAISRRPTETSERTTRSAILKEDSYTAEERQRRRRSRSINFRDQEVDGHFRGEKFCERPGAEAEMMGRYLNHYEDMDRRDQMDYQYSSRGGKKDVDVGYDRRESDRYGSKARSKSRGGGRRDEDDRSYVDTYRSKTTKTYY